MYCPNCAVTELKPDERQPLNKTIVRCPRCKKAFEVGNFGQM